MSQVMLVPIMLWVAALASAAVAIWQGPRPIDRSFLIDRLLRSLFVFPLGLLGLWAFLGHVFFAEQSAASIGWGEGPRSDRGRGGRAGPATGSPRGALLDC